MVEYGGDFLKERQRLASVPVSLEALPRLKVIQRVRMNAAIAPGRMATGTPRGRFSATFSG